MDREMVLGMRMVTCVREGSVDFSHCGGRLERNWKDGEKGLETDLFSCLVRIFSEHLLQVGEDEGP